MASSAHRAKTPLPSRRLHAPSFGVQVLVGMLAGLGLGLAARAIGGDSHWRTETLATVGAIFVQLL